MEIDFNKDIPPQLQPMDQEVVVLYKLLDLILQISNVNSEDRLKVWKLTQTAYVVGGVKGMESALNLVTEKTLEVKPKHGLD